MDIFGEKNLCCGCTACCNACPKNAITMKADEKGFYYPSVDEELCVNCGICKNVCDFQKSRQEEHIDLDDNKVFAVKHKDFSERISSRSGGAFMAFCDYILERNGVIYGAAFDENLKVKHIRAENKSQVNRLKGSKYVQSDMGNTFSMVKNDLKGGKYVLFSGTPCQTAGLKSFLKKIDTEKLIICDIVCHGAPSPLFYEDYLKYLEKKCGSAVTEFNFRDKFFGWAPHIESYVTKKKYFSNIYTDLFYKHIMFRPSCEKCRYTNFNRPSDITLADFWGIDKAVSGFNDNKGVSLIIVNTKKGQRIIEEVNSKLEIRESNKDDCLQPNLQHPTVFSRKTDEFWKDYNSGGIEFVMNKYGNNDFISQMKFKIKIFLYKHNLRGM